MLLWYLRILTEHIYLIKSRDSMSGKNKINSFRKSCIYKMSRNSSYQKCSIHTLSERKVEMRYVLYIH